VPGCSGFASLNGVNVYEERAAELQNAGYFVVFVDYLGRFGNCGHMSHEQVGDAIIEAATWVREQPRIDATRIAAIGWSYGGGGLLAALRAQSAGPPVLSRAVMYYPDCRGEAAWTASGITGLMLLGANDDVARPAQCEPVARQQVPSGSLRVISYPQAYHSFDVRSLPERAEYPFGTLGYNAEAAAGSWGAVVDFLK
jgi:dienelactone hydrolase